MLAKIDFMAKDDSPITIQWWWDVLTCGQFGDVGYWIFLYLTFSGVFFVTMYAIAAATPKYSMYYLTIQKIKRISLWLVWAPFLLIALICFL